MERGARKRREENVRDEGDLLDYATQVIEHS
jgi:hypothetical protein